MKNLEKSLNDLYDPISFISLNLKLIKKYRNIHNSSISKYITYCIINLFHNTVVYIGIVFDKTRHTSSLFKFNQKIESNKLKITEYKKWNKLYNSTFSEAKKILYLRNNFHAHKNEVFDIKEYWEQNPDEYDKITLVVENCIKLLDILSQDILGFKFDFDTTCKGILDQFNVLFKEYEN